MHISNPSNSYWHKRPASTVWSHPCEGTSNEDRNIQKLELEMLPFIESFHSSRKLSSYLLHVRAVYTLVPAVWSSLWLIMCGTLWSLWGMMSVFISQNVLRMIRRKGGKHTVPITNSEWACIYENTKVYQIKSELIWLNLPYSSDCRSEKFAHLFVVSPV